MRSMRVRLFYILLITTGIVWLSAVAWIFASTDAQLQKVLDTRLMEAARMVSSLVVKQDMGQKADPVIPMEAHPAYNRQLSCQIWTIEGELISKSDGAPDQELSAEQSGFSETTVNGEAWRVYTVHNADVGVRVMVGDRIDFRDQLINNMIKGLLLPALLILPVLAGLIWLSLGRGLFPLKAIADNLHARDASDFSPLESAGVAREIAPVVKALNGLFGRVAGIREREQNFTAFAAHELRTPLAGLKTQAQIALASSDPAIREKALSQIVHGVDRTGRLVRQLLDLAAIEAGEPSPQRVVIPVGETLKALRHEVLGHVAPHADFVIDACLLELRLVTHPDLFRLAARNLIENALLHTPEGGTIRCSLTQTSDELAIRIDDEGPGIPEDELERATERFFRGRHKSSVGSGLGLSIVELALRSIGARLTLTNRAEGGLSAAIVVPVDARA